MQKQSSNCLNRAAIGTGAKKRIALAHASAHHPPVLARVLSAAVSGIAAFPVEVNSVWVDTIVVIVGLPDASKRLIMQTDRF
jgi:hypothetical protein